MHKFITIAAALADGTMWSLGPACAQTTTDRVEDKTKSTTETIKDKAEDVKDTVKDKAVRAKDKVKETFTHAKDKMRSKTDGRVAMADTRAAQGALKTQGFDPGPIDGRMGPLTSAALSDYQRKNDLPVTGMLDDATMAKLEVRSTRSTDVPAASPANKPDPKKQTQ
jgi:peptidoglycan hydrolase-like protein with peptidoglycan-binding domain